jgi:uncharacterized protein involved in exopolysaccharide biosynthesis
MTEQRVESLPPGAEREKTFLDFLVVLAKHKKLIFRLPIAAGFMAVIVSLLLPKWYTATAKIMPPQQSQSNAVAILGQLGVLTGGGASQALGLKNPSDVYVTMFKSRTVADKLIERFDLKNVYGEEYLFETRKQLARNSSITSSRDGIITIEVEDTDPKRATDIANAYVEELRNVTVHLAVSEASQRRVFFEGQLKKAKDDLGTAEVELKKFAQGAGLVNPDGQATLTVTAAAQLRAQITAREVNLAAARLFATEDNPEVKRIHQELAGLRTELARMDKNVNIGKGDVLVSVGRAPEVGLEYVRRLREVKYFEALFEILAKQYEIARIDEAKDATLIQVLDAAVQPEIKSKPKRTLIVLLTVLVAVILSIVLALMLESLQRAFQDPDRAALLRQLRNLILARRPSGTGT